MGVFGVVPGMRTGSVTVTPLDDPSKAVTVPLVNGAFSALTLESLRGRFTASFTAPGATPITRRFTKDASRYYVLLAAPDLHVALTGLPASIRVGTATTATINVSNAGPSAANGVTLRLAVPPGMAVVSTAPGPPAVWCTRPTRTQWCLPSGRSPSVRAPAFRSS